MRSRFRKSRSTRSNPMKWSMWVCDTKTCVTLKSSAAGRPSLRPRSNSTARPCQRSSTKRPGSPKGPFTRRGAKDDAMRAESSREDPPCPRPELFHHHTRVEEHGASRSARPLLHLLHDHGGGLAHHLLEDLAELALGVLELLHQAREQREVPLDGIGLEPGDPPLHGDAEALVRHVDVRLEGCAHVLVHRRPAARWARAAQSRVHASEEPRLRPSIARRSPWSCHQMVC